MAAAATPGASLPAGIIVAGFQPAAPGDQCLASVGSHCSGVHSFWELVGFSVQHIEQR